MLEPEVLFVLAILGLVFVVLAVLGWLFVTGVRSHRRSLREWREQGERDQSDLKLDQRVDLHLASGNAAYTLHPGNQTQQPYLEVVVDRGAGAGEFTIVAENWFDRLCKRIGLAREVQTDDAAFDARFYILSDTPDFARAFFTVADNRQAIAELFEHGFCKASYDGAVFRAEFSPFRKSAGHDLTLVHRAAECLHRLARQVPTEAGAPPHVRLAVRKGVAATWALLAALGVALVSLLWFRPVRSWPPFRFSLAMSLPSLLAFLWVSAFVVRGRAHSHRQFLALAVAAAIAFPFGGYGLTVLANGALDRHEPESHTLTVRNKWEGRSGRHNNVTTYNISVPHWRTPGEEVYLRTGRESFLRITPGLTRIEVAVHPGWLGYEWIGRWAIKD